MALVPAVVTRSRSAGLVFGLGGLPTMRKRSFMLSGIPWTGTYDPAVDAGAGYEVAPGDYGAYDAAKSDYQIAQLRAAGVTNIVYDPYSRIYVNGDTAKIYNDAGTGMDIATEWTTADQTALDQRIQTVLNDPQSTDAAKKLVQLPGYGTPEFDQQLQTDSVLANHVDSLLTQSAAQRTSTDYVPPGEDYLVGGQHFTTLADATAAQQTLTATGQTLLPATGGNFNTGNLIPGNALTMPMPASGSGSGGGVFGGGGGATMEPGMSGGTTGNSGGSMLFPLLLAGGAAFVLLGGKKRRR